MTVYIKIPFGCSGKEWLQGYVLENIPDYYFDCEYEFIYNDTEWCTLTDSRDGFAYASDDEDEEEKRLESDINIYLEYIDWWIENNNVKKMLRDDFWLRYPPGFIYENDPEKRYFLSYRTVGSPYNWYVNVLSFDRDYLEQYDPADQNNRGFGLIEVETDDEVKEKVNALLDAYFEYGSDASCLYELLTNAYFPKETFNFDSLPDEWTVEIASEESALEYFRRNINYFDCIEKDNLEWFVDDGQEAINETKKPNFIKIAGIDVDSNPGTKEWEEDGLVRCTNNITFISLELDDYLVDNPTPFIPSAVRDYMSELQDRWEKAVDKRARYEWENDR